uniref:Uncharacterized protein n=1 Tax=Pararge aegeria TaxID=116150 RepID=S4PAM1_9NEOP
MQFVNNKASSICCGGRICRVHLQVIICPMRSTYHPSNRIIVDAFKFFQYHTVQFCISTLFIIGETNWI